MCGIAGLYNPNGTSRQHLKLMADAIGHRGPDADGYFVHSNFGIAHRRLSIIDLSTAANQPMQSGCGRYQMVFNGEIYNYHEVTKDLKVALKTNSDTEVLVEAFAQWGPEMVNRLNGMFSIAILDTHQNQIYLFRDRLGIKPLFVFQNKGLLAFASELKAIKALGSAFNPTVNNESIPYFLHLGYIPEPLTIYNEVTKFPAGHWAVFDGESLKMQCYWSAEDRILKNAISNEKIAVDQLESLVTESVQKRLMSDVPFGTFLSGGIDSSLVSALAQNVSSEKLKTFSIGFKDAKYNEANFAREVAEHLKTEHHEYMVTEQDALDLVLEIIPQYDEPYADSSAIPTMLVSKMARQEVKMTLSGDGGDELFMGYGSYQWARRMNNPIIKGLRTPIGSILSSGNDRYKRVAKLFQFNPNDYLPAHIFSQEQYLFRTQEISDLLIAPTDRLSFKNPETDRKLSIIENQALFDLNYYLKDDLLTKVDRASMKYSLETRVPLLDHNVVEFALNLDESLKIRNGVSKYLLKTVLFRHVPEKLFHRPKWGFSVPLGRWLHTELKFLVDDYLSKENIETIGLVNYSKVSQLVQKFNSGQNHLYNRIWVLIMLHNWARFN